VKLPAGQIMDDYFISKLGDVSMVIPVTEENEFVMVRQYKHGIQEITLEFPAGVVEEGEDPLSTAYAELEQETGIVADNMVLLGELRTLPTKNLSRFYGFISRNVKITKDQDLDISEEIEIVKLSMKEVEEKIISGEINCSDTVALYALYRLKSNF
jgi:8-oxo-dGTP pyrophosphatase MutT (NUDIX family)